VELLLEAAVPFVLVVALPGPWSLTAEEPVEDDDIADTGTRAPSATCARARATRLAGTAGSLCDMVDG